MALVLSGLGLRLDTIFADEVTQKLQLCLTEHTLTAVQCDSYGLNPLKYFLKTLVVLSLVLPEDENIVHQTCESI